MELLLIMFILLALFGAISFIRILLLIADYFEKRERRKEHEE